MAKVNPSFSSTNFCAYFINCHGHYRVWRDGWGADQFEVVSNEQFDQIADTCKRLSIPFIDKTAD